MNLPHPLKNCVITGLPQTPALPFTPVLSSLRYQSMALGMSLTHTVEQMAVGQQLSLTLQVPEATPIACDIHGWPDDLSSTATEFTMQAACGLMSVHGRASGRVQALGVNYVSTLAATLALQGVLAAAVGQRHGLPVQQVSTSLASAGLLAVGQYLAGATAPEAPEKILPGSTSMTDRPPFVSADGVAFELETLEAQPWRAFWTELAVDMDSAGKGWHGFLLRYAKAIAPVPSALVSALAHLPYARIADLCARTGVSICPVRSLEERSHDEDARQMWRQGPWAFTSEPSAGAHFESRRASGTLPLSGLTVIESCRRIQGPLAGHLLALLGATVIRIEPPGGDPLRGMPPLTEGVSARFDALNRLKTVREIDIKSAQGQAEIHALVRKADVFLHNWAPGKAAELQLDSADLKRINPELVYAYAGGWGAANQHGLPGTDFIAQAYSGVAHKIARTSNTRGGSLFTVLDVLGGAVAAQGVVAALLSRLLQPAGIRMESSLLGAASLLCADDFGVLFHPQDSSPPANSALQAVYPTQQGLLAIDCPDAQTVAALARAVDFREEIGATELHARLLEVLQSKTAHQWLALLDACGIPAAVAMEDLTELHNNPRLASCLMRDSYTCVNSPWRLQS